MIGENIEPVTNKMVECQATAEFQSKIYGHIGKYAKPNLILSIYHLMVTIILLLFCFQFETLWMVPFFSLMFVRTFVVFHDIVHGAFFKSETINWLIGLILGTFVMTSCSYWDEGHTYHHKNSNKLNVDQQAQTAAWDIDQYNNSSWLSKILYKLKYGMFTLFTINPIFYFFVLHRIYAKWYENVLHFAYMYILYLYLSPSQYLYFALTFWVTAIIGFLMFHIQHTFDNVYKAYDPPPKENYKQWNRFMNGMFGSSFLQVPWFLKYFTCNIQYHHIHHLNCKVPFYYLEECHQQGGTMFDQVQKVTIMDIFRSLPYSLYNTPEKKFVNVYAY